MRCRYFRDAGTSAWQVSTGVGGTDGAFSSFSTADFLGAAERATAPGWISNLPSGTNGPLGDQTFFVSARASR